MGLGKTGGMRAKHPRSRKEGADRIKVAGSLEVALTKVSSGIERRETLRAGNDNAVGPVPHGEDDVAHTLVEGGQHRGGRHLLGAAGWVNDKLLVGLEFSGQLSECDAQGSTAAVEIIVLQQAKIGIGGARGSEGVVALTN
jgi:hypothetical protein